MLYNQWLRLNAGLRRVDAGLEITWSRTGTGFMPCLPGLPGWNRVTGARERFLVKNNFGRIICLQPGKPGKHGITLVLNRFQLLPCWFWTWQFNPATWQPTWHFSVPTWHFSVPTWHLFTFHTHNPCYWSTINCSFFVLMPGWLPGCRVKLPGWNQTWQAFPHSI